MSDKTILELANFYLGKHVQEHSDYARRYEEMIAQHKTEVTDKAELINAREDTERIEDSVIHSEEELIQKLKEFRLKQSQEENVKPYYIFNNAQMQDLVSKNPKNKEELLMVSGFGKTKVEKYGETILEILKTDS